MGIFHRVIHKVMTSIGVIRTFKNWPKFFIYYFGIKRGNDIIFKFRNGLKWHVNAEKRGFAVLSDIWVQKPYNLITKIKNPKIIFDFGAHIGSFSIMAAKMFPKAKIYSFEASKENYSYLLRNIRENKVKNIHPYNVGIGDSDKELEFFINEKNTILNSFIKGKQKNNTSSYKVRCKKISTIFSELNITYCDLLKIDIEGMEFKVLERAKKDNVLGKINAIATEIDPHDLDFKKTANLLSRNRFSVSSKGDIISAVRK